MKETEKRDSRRGRTIVIGTVLILLTYILSPGPIVVMMGFMERSFEEEILMARNSGNTVKLYEIQNRKDRVMETIEGSLFLFYPLIEGNRRLEEWTAFNPLKIYMNCCFSLAGQDENLIP